jgi:hypothetical protein
MTALLEKAWAEVSKLSPVRQNAIATIILQELEDLRNPSSRGRGNYTEERDAIFADMTLDDLVAAIKQQRNELSQDNE